MFTKQRRHIRNRRRAHKPINWANVAACVFLAIVGTAFFALCLGAIYYGG